MTKPKYRSEIPDILYWKKQIKCQWGCPVHTDSRGYVIAISEGRYLDAYRIARGPNPFASICGRVCGAPCEVECRRGAIDDPVTIRALKRFVTEKYGIEAQEPASTIKFSNARRDPDNPMAGTKVAVIGSGVSGLSAAHDLALLGYQVTVFEADSIAGGMLIKGVPIYRLPRKLVQKEIEAILSLGVELKLNVTIGKDITIPELREKGFKAILLASGLQKSRKLEIKGIQAEGILHGIEFLKDVNLGKEVELGDRVVVLGGGNVAFDVARSALRPQTMEGRAEVEDFYEATNAARLAIRKGAKEVHLVCLESRSEMPADETEIHEGIDEGIILHTSRGPFEVMEKNGKVTGLATRKVKSVFDQDGRFNPEYDKDPGEVIETDTIIFAVGQETDFNFLQNAQEIKVSQRGLIEIDPETQRTSAPDIFACGDVSTGAKLFIHAIAGGQKAAASIDEYLRGNIISQEIEYDFSNITPHIMNHDYLNIECMNPEVMDSITRAKSHEIIELNFDEASARAQGKRCLKCHINTIFNGDLCISCGGCVDVCPTDCLKIIGLSEIEIRAEQESLFQEIFGMDLKDYERVHGSKAIDALGSVMLKDESRCIRCGYCEKRCPTGAVTLEHFTFKEHFSHNG